MEKAKKVVFENAKKLVLKWLGNCELEDVYGYRADITGKTVDAVQNRYEKRIMDCEDPLELHEVLMSLDYQRNFKRSDSYSLICDMLCSDFALTHPAEMLVIAKEYKDRIYLVDVVGGEEVNEYGLIFEHLYDLYEKIDWYGADALAVVDGVFVTGRLLKDKEQFFVSTEKSPSNGRYFKEPVKIFADMQKTSCELFSIDELTDENGKLKSVIQELDFDCKEKEIKTKI